MPGLRGMEKRPPSRKWGTNGKPNGKQHHGLSEAKMVKENGPKMDFRGLDGQNRQSPIASVQRTQSTLAGLSAVPRGMNVKRMDANRAIRIAAQ